MGIGRGENARRKARERKSERAGNTQRALLGVWGVDWLGVGTHQIRGQEGRQAATGAPMGESPKIPTSTRRPPTRSKPAYVPRGATRSRDPSRFCRSWAQQPDCFRPTVSRRGREHRLIIGKAKPYQSRSSILHRTRQLIWPERWAACLPPSHFTLLDPRGRGGGRINFEIGCDQRLRPAGTGHKHFGSIGCD